MSTPEARVRITGEDATGSAWASALGQAKTTADSMRTLFAGTFAGLSLVGIGAAVSQSLQLGESLKKAGEAAGVSAGTMSELAYVGKQAGVSMEELSVGLKKMEDAVSKAATGSGEEALALEVLHLKASDLLKLSPDKMFEAIGGAIGALPDPTDRARAAIDFFGRSGTQLIGIFSQGADAIEKARQKARDLGLALTNETIDKLAAAEAKVKDLNAAFGNLWTTLVSKVAPGLSDMATHLTVDLSDSKIAKLKQQLADLQGLRSTQEGGPEVDTWFDRQKKAIEDELAYLQGLKPGETALHGTIQRPAAAAAAPGGAGATDSSGSSRFAQIEAERQAWEDLQKELTDADKEIAAANKQAMDDLARQGNEQAREDEKYVVQWAERWSKARAQALEEQEKLDAGVKHGSELLIAGIDEFRGTFVKALDDFLIKGEFTFKKLGAYIAEAIATKELNSALNTMLDGLEVWLDRAGRGGGGGAPGSGGGGRSPSGTSSGSGGGYLSALFSAGTAAAGGSNGFASMLSSLFGGGGDGVSAADWATAYSQIADVTNYSLAQDVASEVPAFAQGGAFDVPGSGGTDSSLVAFAATPGERVSVGQQGQSAGAYNFNNTYHIDARGADAERIMRVMPTLMSQAAEKAKRDILDAFNRGGFAAPRTA